MEYRKSSSLGLIKCSCGEEIRKGDYGYVPVIEKDGIPVFGRTLCKKCMMKKDQDVRSSLIQLPVRADWYV
ncbi:MAG: hypothetical protein QXZ17_00280 [Nitrososphaerota archaeon]